MMKRTFIIGLTALIILNLSACDSPAMEGEFVLTAEATLQDHGLLSGRVQGKDRPVNTGAMSSSLEINQTEDTGDITGTPTSVPSAQKPTATPLTGSVSNAASSQQERVLPSPTPLPTSTPTPLPPPTSMPLPPTSTPPPTSTLVQPTPTFFALGGTSEFRVGPLYFSPQPSTVDRNTAFNFGVSFRFVNTSEVGVSLIAFPRYTDETVTTTIAGCMAGTMPAGHPDRPFWSTGTEQIYAPGEHSFSQTYIYSEAISESPHLVLWVIARQNGQVHYCAQRLYTFSP